MNINDNKILPSESLITELAFKLILDSEEAEGFEFNVNTVDAQGEIKLLNIDKRTVLEFLKDEYTKLAIKVDEEWSTSYLTASNSLSNETIEIRGLSDHYLALLKMVDKSVQTRAALKKDKSTPILTHNFVKGLNLALQRNKESEIGIGEYRNLDYCGRPVEVCVTTTAEDGTQKPVESVTLAPHDLVEEKMDELIEWVNTEAFSTKIAELYNKRKSFSFDIFKSKRDSANNSNQTNNISPDLDLLKNVAKFHTRFIKTHPFRDGNGRTARLLSNYILLTFDQPVVSIPIKDKNEYIQALNFANSDDISMTAKEIPKFAEFLATQYHKLNPDVVYATPEEIVAFMDAYRTEDTRYDFVYETFKNHQLSISSGKVVDNILNNYGQKNLDLHIGVGKIKSNQVDYEQM